VNPSDNRIGIERALLGLALLVAVVSFGMNLHLMGRVAAIESGAPHAAAGSQPGKTPGARSGKGGGGRAAGKKSGGDEAAGADQRSGAKRGQGRRGARSQDITFEERQDVVRSRLEQFTTTQGLEDSQAQQLHARLETLLEQTAALRAERERGELDASAYRAQVSALRSEAQVAAAEIVGSDACDTLFDDLFPKAGKHADGERSPQEPQAPQAAPPTGEGG
jgi:hypothetical protein